MPKITTPDLLLEFLSTLGIVPPFRKTKSKAMFDLAGCVDSQYDIVELGAYQGWGTIALACGAENGLGAKVTTIDEHKYRVDWSGREYLATDEKIFKENIAKAKVIGQIIYLKMSVDKALDNIKNNIGLLVWDLGDDKKRGDYPLYSDFLKWKEKVIDGGMMLLIDTFDRGFGSSLVIDYVADNPDDYEIIWNEKGILVVCRTRIV